VISGQRVTLRVNNQTVSGTIIMGSDNRQSLMVGLEDGLRLGGGLYVNMIPLLQNEAGQYCDLAHGAVVDLTWDD
jgi:hypothetical protein